MSTDNLIIGYKPDTFTMINFLESLFFAPDKADRFDMADIMELLQRLLEQLETLTTLMFIYIVISFLVLSLYVIYSILKKFML